MAFSFQEYKIIDEIGRGAYGTVYRARQHSLNRVVAIKSLSPQRAQNRHDIIRFRQEAQAMASLAHDAIVTVYDYAFHHGRYYIVMEYVDGTTLESLFAQSASVQLMLFVLERITDALICAHEKGIIHRDL
ncbi:MAG: serine/threonine-protein kinase, partial [Chitinivibrionales bacterium]